VSGTADLRVQVAAEIRAWQSDVLALVAEEGAGKRATARVLSFGVNGLGAALMVVVFASTSGLTGAEIGIAGGSALLAQRLLEAVFGDDAVRQLARSAADRLAVRARGIMAGQSRRFTVALDALETEQASGDALRAAANAVATAAQRARTAGFEPAGAAAPVFSGGALRGAGAGVRPGAVTAADGSASSKVRPWWRRMLRGPGAP